ncbi:MAG: hypothetical protein WBL35_05320 [Ornithinibacter sp.]
MVNVVHRVSVSTDTMPVRVTAPLVPDGSDGSSGRVGESVAGGGGEPGEVPLSSVVDVGLDDTESPVVWSGGLSVPHPAKESEITATHRRCGSRALQFTASSSHRVVPMTIQGRPKARIDIRLPRIGSKAVIATAAGDGLRLLGAAVTLEQTRAALRT